ncbi:hypothetical protein HYALB_00002272 [Hymenoscyphus albidus]|uniref:Uncharacterized protein n=1 Tax=Hymenoscyphus albidus TaxID=595503 RepID=A0A9N9M1U4_9HELO|nr:hypothetical protein HYALB_00002272 [Hymenoscyphus albidus]
MAQGAVAAMAVTPAMAPTGDANALAGLSAEELREMLEYEKIVKFRDAVLAGTHPRVKIPPHLAPKTTRNLSSPSTTTISHTNSSPHPPFPPPTHATPQIQTQTQTSQNGDLSSHSTSTSTNNHRPAASNQIDPIFLEKSDDLIKAEMTLQRVRLERALRDQIEDQKIKNKALVQMSEALPNFNISDVLLQAQALVNPSTSAQVEPVVAADTPADDSFDENTFYSSQHDSSEWSNSPRGQKDPADKLSHDIVSVDKRPGEISPPDHGVRDTEIVKSSLSTTNNQAEARCQAPALPPSETQRQFPGLRYPENIPPQRAGMTSTSTQAMSNQQMSGSESDQAFNNPASSTAHAAVQDTTDQLLRQAFDHARPPPLIRAHNLSPVAPQPARVSPLATAREPPILRENLLADEAPLAQVAALRAEEPAGISSADSSPRGPKSSEKKKSRSEKRPNKRKANSGDTPNSPYIKLEPKSPSPYAVAPLPRPPKRQRQQDQYAAELNYDDQPRHEAPIRTRSRPEEIVEGARASRPFEIVEDRYEPEFRQPDNAYRRIEREDEGYRRVVPDALVPRPRSPVDMYAAPYSGESHPIRAASHALIERRVEEPRYYKDLGPRTIVRPDADRERSRSPSMRDTRPLPMGPPRRPVRIVLDEHGREYYDPGPAYAPTPSSSYRQSVAPPSRYREGDIVYERAPVRAVSSRVATEYEEDGVIYRRGSSLSAAPRRVVTQPEYAMAPPAEYRSYREREYSVRPTAMAPPGDEYTPVRAPEFRHTSQYDESPREYIPRPPIEGTPIEYASRPISVRPEAVRYEVRGEAPREYARAPSVRPEAVRYEIRGEPLREYGRAPSVRPEPIRYETREEAYGSRAMSVRPEVRYEPARESYISRVSVRPEVPPREYASSVRPEAQDDGHIRRGAMAPPKGERYYEEAPRCRPSEIAFVERPRARESSVVAYADDVRRELYR